MKAMLGRTTPLYSSDYAFRDIYGLATAADEDVHSVDGALKGLSGWISCFERARLSGTVFAGGVDAVGDIQGHPSLNQAYEMGKGVGRNGVVE